MTEYIEPYEAEKATIYGHGVWHYILHTTIGDFHIVEWEAKGMEIKRQIIDGDNSKAEKLFKKVCHQMTDGKLI